MNIGTAFVVWYNGGVKKIYLRGIILIIIIAMIFSMRFVWSDKKVEVPQDITYTNATSDLIVVELPFPGAVTDKEFSVIGKARGYWFFEASFPIEVLDKDGKSLAIGIAQAQPDPVTGEINWMTENFVPFKADIKVPTVYIGPATLVLKKDNPSGLPENDASISIPVNFE